MRGAEDDAVGRVQGALRRRRSGRRVAGAEADDGDGERHRSVSSCGGGLVAAEAEDGHEGFLRDLDVADHLHPLLALFLLLEQLALAGDVAAVALGEHVLAHRPDRLAGDDPAADRGLDRHLEHLARDQLAQLLRPARGPWSRRRRGG